MPRFVHVTYQFGGYANAVYGVGTALTIYVPPL